MAGANIKTRLWCHFCGQNITKPQYGGERNISEFPVGECQCGAVYACDATGHNIGSAMVECLVMACGDNWDLAWDLMPDQDYLTGRLENYDEETNQIVETRNLDGRAVRGVIYFIRLQKDLAELVEMLGDRKTSVSRKTLRPVISKSVAIEQPRDPKRIKARASKTLVKKFVEDRNVDGLVDLCFDDKRTFRFIRRLLYTPDDSQRWSTAYLLGQVCARVSTLQPGLVSDQLHRLYESCTDSSASNWGAVEAIGSIIAARADLYGSFTHHLLNFINDDLTRSQVIWALGEVADQNPEVIRKAPFYQLFDLLASQFAEVRGLSVRLFGRIRASEVESRIESLCGDEAELTYYEKGVAIHTTVAVLARQVLSEIRETSGDSPQT